MRISMITTTEHLQQLGISIEEAREFLANNKGIPDVIFRISQENDITTEMLAEIMGNGTAASDVQFFLQSNGYNTQHLDLSPEEYLAERGADIDDIKDSIFENAQSPEAIFALTSQYGLTPEMLAEIIGGDFKPHDVVGYFEDGGFSKELLDSVSEGSHDEFVPLELHGANLPPLDFFPIKGFVPFDEFISSDEFINPTSADTAEHLHKQGFSVDDMKDFLENNAESPDEFFRISQENDFTTDMLAEIMGGKTKAADVQFFMQSNGYNTQLLDLSTDEFLAEKGVDLDDMKNSILANADSPESIFALSSEYGLTPDMLAEIVGGDFKPEDVLGYFEGGGLDVKQLDFLPPEPDDDFIPFKLFGDDLPPLDFFPTDDFVPFDDFLKNEGFILPPPPEGGTEHPEGDLPPLPGGEFDHPDDGLPPPDDDFIKLDGSIPPDDGVPPPDDFIPPHDDSAPPPPPPPDGSIII